jgi:FtsZ-binding cell division protein ZapB
MFNKIRMLFNKSRVASNVQSTSARDGKLIPSPGMQIREISVTGVLEGREKFVHQLSLNSKLTVRRDLENPADPKAVCVTNANGDILGFIPQKYAHPIAEKMDAEEWVPECVIVRLERSPDGKILALRLALSIPDVLCTDNSTPLLEFTCAPGSTGAMYIMLNCEASLLNVLLEKLKQNGVECAKFGTAARREIGGHNYDWYVRLPDSATEAQAVNFFETHYAVKPWGTVDTEDVTQYAEVFDKELKSKDDQLAEQKQALEDAQTKLRESRREGKTKNEQGRQEAIQAMLPNVSLVRDSWDVLLRELADPKGVLTILQRSIFIPKEVDAKRVQSATEWKEYHFNTGQKNDGRLYFRCSGTRTDVLIGFKSDQEKDIEWLKRQ